MTGILLIAGCNQYATTQEVLDLRNLLTDRTPPSIISPSASGGGRATNQQITLQWSSKASAGAYIVDVASDSGFASAISGSPFRVAAPATSLAVTLPSTGRYYWKVRANYNSTTEFSSGVFDSIATVVYVYCPGSFTTCDDANQGGSIASPFRTINGALTYAKSNSSIVEIQVATRDSGASYNEIIVAVSGVSIKGGYTSAFTEATRNLGSNQTKVSFAGTVLFAINLTQTTNIQGFNFMSTGSASSIVLVSSCTNAFTLQNNRIETTVSQPGPSYGVLVQNSGTSPSNGPLFTNNVILSGNVSTIDSTTAGMRIESSAPIIKGNYIRAGTIGTASAGFYSWSIGINVVSANPMIVNNVIIGNINGGSATSYGVGIYLNPAGAAIVTNNTISTLSGTGNPYAIAINGGGTVATFTNNLLFNCCGGYGFYEWNAASDPVSLHNNAFIGGGVLYRDEGVSDRTVPGDLNTTALTTQVAGTANGNVRPAIATCAAPFVNYTGDDYRLSQGTCVGGAGNEWSWLLYGGKNTSQSVCGATTSSTCGNVTDDLNVVTRTPILTLAPGNAGAAGYSIGAYEQD